MKIPASLCLIGACLAPVCFAAEPPTFDPIVVTPSGTDTPWSDTLASVTVITREEIDHAQASDVAELLRFTAGVELGRSGGPGQQTSVFIRGANSNHTLVLIDGVRVNRLTAGGATLENVSPDMIDHIEIVKGPRATLYGSDAVGGVINIITRRARGVNAEMRVRGGSYQTLDAGGFAGYGNDAGDVALHAQHQETRGIPAAADQPQPSNFRQNTFDFGGHVNAGPVKLGARLWEARARAGYYTFNPVSFALDTPVSQSLHNTLVAFDAAATPFSIWQTTLTAAENLDRIEQRESSDFLRSRRPSLDWHNVLALTDWNRLSFGAEAAHEYVEASTFGSTVVESRELYSAFVEDQVDSGKHHALLAGSVQHNQAFGEHYNWNAEYGYDLLATTRLIAAAGTGFRAPTASERFGFGGNPDLKPESARNYEVGARQQMGVAQSVDVRLFRMDVRDLIVTTCDASFNCTNFNIGRFRNQGVELAWNLHTTSWAAEISGTIQNPEHVDQHQPLLRRAKRSAAARVTRRFGPHFVGIDVLATSQRPDFGSQLGGYALLNLTAGYEIVKHLRIEVRGENLLDHHYQTAAGYNQPGISGYATLIYSY